MGNKFWKTYYKQQIEAQNGEYDEIKYLLYFSNGLKEFERNHLAYFLTTTRLSRDNIKKIKRTARSFRLHSLDKRLNLNRVRMQHKRSLNKDELWIPLKKKNQLYK